MTNSLTEQVEVSWKCGNDWKKCAGYGSCAHHRLAGGFKAYSSGTEKVLAVSQSEFGGATVRASWIAVCVRVPKKGRAASAIRVVSASKADLPYLRKLRVAIAGTPASPTLRLIPSAFGRRHNLYLSPRSAAFMDANDAVPACGVKIRSSVRKPWPKAATDKQKAPKLLRIMSNQGGGGLVPFRGFTVINGWGDPIKVSATIENDWSDPVAGPATAKQHYEAGGCKKTDSGPPTNKTIARGAPPTLCKPKDAVRASRVTVTVTNDTGSKSTTFCVVVHSEAAGSPPDVPPHLSWLKSFTVTVSKDASDNIVAQPSDFVTAKREDLAMSPTDTDFAKRNDLSPGEDPNQVIQILASCP